MTPEPEIDFETAKAELERKVYDAACYLESLEHKGLIYGNGHHAAQKIAAFAVEQLKYRWKDLSIAHSSQPPQS